jgi:uncharacterized cupin superfamily protein
MSRRVRILGDLPLERVRAHGGEGTIHFRRLFEAAEFAGPWRFVDYAVLPPGASIGVHRHEGDEELYLVLEGEGRMRLDDEEIDVRAGSVIVNRDGGVHGLVNTGDRDLRLFVVDVGTDLNHPRGGGHGL